MSSVKENQSVRNACSLIEGIATAQPIGVSDLARLTGIDKSAAHRIAITLQRAGWLHQGPDSRWRVAPALAALVTPASIDTLVEMVRAQLEGARDASGETAMLVVLERDRLMVRAVAESRHALRITAPAGSELPARSSSALRAIASHAGPDDLVALRVLDPGLDDKTLDETRNRGWAINDREITPDTRVVGAAILTAEGHPLGALIVCAPTSRVGIDEMHAIGAQVAGAAAQVVLGADARTATRPSESA